MLCKRCDKDKMETEFYPHRNRPNTKIYCKQCCTEQSLERQRQFKILCVEYKGRQM